MHFYRYLPFKNPIGLLCRLIVSWKLGHKKIWFKILVGLTALRYILYLSLYYWCQTINAFERKCFIGNEQSKNKQFLCSGKFMKWSCFCFLHQWYGALMILLRKFTPRRQMFPVVVFLFTTRLFLNIDKRESTQGKSNFPSLFSWWVSWYY